MLVLLGSSLHPKGQLAPGALQSRSCKRPTLELQGLRTNNKRGKFRRRHVTCGAVGTANWASVDPRELPGESRGDSPKPELDQRASGLLLAAAHVDTTATDRNRRDKMD